MEFRKQLVVHQQTPHDCAATSHPSHSTWPPDSLPRLLIFRDLFNADASNSRGQRLDLNRSAARIPKTLSAGGRGPMNNRDGHDEYINNTLAEEFSKLSIDNPPLAPYVCPVGPSALSIPMLTRSQGNTSTFSNLERQQSAYTLSDTEGRHASGQATGQAGRTNHLSRSSQLTLAR
jgi:hypothetical protein